MDGGLDGRMCVVPQSNLPAVGFDSFLVECFFSRARSERRACARIHVCCSSSIGTRSVLRTRLVEGNVAIMTNSSEKKLNAAMGQDALLVPAAS